MLADSLVPVLTAAVGAVAGAIGAYVAIRRDKREARSAVLAESDQTIALLKEQNDVLRTMAESAQKRADDARAREERLEIRVNELERDYRRLVTTITTMSQCARAKVCPAYSATDTTPPRLVAT